MVVQNNQNQRSAVMNVMVSAVHRASRSLIRDFNEIEHLQVSRKGLGDFVSTADYASEKILVAELSRARPEYGFLVEESGVIEGEDPLHRWVIDPLDGTTNFLHGIPHFAISLALQKGDEVIAAIIHNPATDEMFWAEKGRGAYVNQRRLRVSGRRQLSDALIATGIPFGNTGNKQKFVERAARIMPRTSGLRRMGAAALDLAYVAAGRCEAYFEDGLSPWDIAAGILLVREAGGMVTQIGGSEIKLESDSIFASCHQLYDDIGELL